MRRKKRIITVAIDSPAAAGAGTQAKYIAKEYNLLYLDTGKIYRYIGKLRLKEKKNFSYKSIKQKIKNIKLKCRIDTNKELDYYKAGGILNYVLNEIIAEAA